jgi:hypothetical protein
MHCLYCDRPLALLKRLTGDGAFCSKEHRKIYQKEHSQLAVARLLESQPGNKSRRTASKPAPESKPAQESRPAPRVERLPEPAEFVSDFFLGAVAADGGKRGSGDPVNRARVPEWAGSSYLRISGFSPQPQPRPKPAGFHAGLPSATAQGQTPRVLPGVAPLPGELRLGETGAHALARLQPGRAAFLAEPARPAAGTTAGRPHTAAGPRWKPVAAVIPRRPMGKIILVLESFLRRPVRITVSDSLPESFELRIRAVSFPRYSPRMGLLEERPLRTDSLESVCS